MGYAQCGLTAANHRCHRCDDDIEDQPLDVRFEARDERFYSGSNKTVFGQMTRDHSNLLLFWLPFRRYPEQINRQKDRKAGHTFDCNPVSTSVSDPSYVLRFGPGPDCDSVPIRFYSRPVRNSLPHPTFNPVLATSYSSDLDEAGSKDYIKRCTPVARVGRRRPDSNDSRQSQRVPAPAACEAPGPSRGARGEVPHLVTLRKPTFVCFRMHIESSVMDFVITPVITVVKRLVPILHWYMSPTRTKPILAVLDVGTRPVAAAPTPARHFSRGAASLFIGLKNYNHAFCAPPFVPKTAYFSKRNKNKRTIGEIPHYHRIQTRSNIFWCCLSFRYVRVRRAADSITPSSLHYSSQEAANALITSLELLVSMGSDDHLYPDGSQIANWPQASRRSAECARTSTDSSCAGNVRMKPIYLRSKFESCARLLPLSCHTFNRFTLEANPSAIFKFRIEGFRSNRFQVDPPRVRGLMETVATMTTSRSMG
ncbi:hypothetical protein EVAR_31276_1 [Eumeta japonica]|uniref:Uncharacterized protein n=1 Tax=Eumeta variegata TaxID=151549 RepID=A0A4C1VR59_EUMVA|nr:hypothetical protein EVAR_31276_1 [Eumeta japonica]